MQLTTPVRRRLLAAATVLGLLAAPLVGGAAEAKKPAHPPGKPVTVMTRNLYLGADIQRPVTAAVIAQQLPGATPEKVLVALGNATHVTRAIVDQTELRRPVAAARRRDRPHRARPRRPAGGGVVAARRPAADAGRRPQRHRDRLRLPPDPDGRPRRRRGALRAGQHRPPRRRGGAELHGQSLQRHHGRRRPRRPADHARRDPDARRGRPLRHRRGPAGLHREPDRQRRRGADALRPRLPVGRRARRRDTVPLRQHPPGGVQLRPRAAADQADDARGAGHRPHDGDRLRLQLRPAEQLDEAPGPRAAQGAVRVDHRRPAASPTSGSSGHRPTRAGRPASRSS